MTSVLIVDDSLTVRMDLAGAFEAAGFEPVLCATAADARAHVRQSPVDVVVLDVVLPDGDGVDLLSELRQMPNAAGAPVLMLSTEAEVADRLRGLGGGADDYVGKPYDAAYVTAKSRELLRTRTTADAAAATEVLIIDDSLPFRTALAEALNAAGYATLTAADGQRGLEIAAGRRPDAIIVDGRLPDIDGPTLVRRLRLDSGLHRLPCLLLTTDDDRSAEIQALEAGADSFVRKGDTTLVLAKLAAMVRASTGTRFPDAVTSLHGPKRVLIISTNPTPTATVVEALRGEGVDIIGVDSQRQAQHLLATQAVDCILLSLGPPGPDVREACRLVKAIPGAGDIPLVVIGSPDPGTMVESLSAGADDYVDDLTDAEVVKARFRAHLRRKHYQEEAHRVRDERAEAGLRAAEAHAARELADARAALVTELERKNQELEAFSYSVAHDLRGPLHVVINYGQMLLEDLRDHTETRICDMVTRVLTTAEQMSELVDDLLDLSQISATTVHRDTVNLSTLARAAITELRHREPDRVVTEIIHDDVTAHADQRLMRILMTNLIGNAWKYTAKAPAARIEFGVDSGDRTTYYIRDNGAGFDPGEAERLFRPFERLHTHAQFPGTGVGLATVHRIIERHAGAIWAQGRTGHGATFYFTVSEPDAAGAGADRPPVRTPGAPAGAGSG
jgi:two-component system, NtrC family, sensor kinase